MGVRIDLFQAAKNPNQLVKVKVLFQWYDETDPKNPIKVGKPLMEIFDVEAVDTPEKVQAKIDLITPTLQFMNGLTGPNLKHIETFMVKPVPAQSGEASAASAVAR